MLSIGAIDDPIAANAVAIFHAQDALFAENAGQWANDDVYFGYNKGGAQVYFTDEGIEFGLSRRDLKDGYEADMLDEPGALTPGLEEEAYEYANTHFSLHFDGARATAPVGADMAETVFNYHLGEQTAWVDGVATYKTVVYEDLYDGIDLHAFSRSGQMKYEFHVVPGGDWSQIELTYTGVEGLSLGDDGSLHIETALGPIVDEDLLIYQEINGQRVEVAGHFTLIDADTYTFTVTGPYDATQELVIDPNITWGSYLGGSDWDHASGVAVDNAGNVIAVGDTQSFGWVSGGYDTDLDGDDSDAFVVKLSRSGEHLWSTYLGGNNIDAAWGVAVDGSGSVFAVGRTHSSLWTAGGFDTTYNGDYDGFVVKLGSGGAHLWSTYLGGSNFDEAVGIAIDLQGNVVVGGVSKSSGWVSGGYDTTLNGAGDAIVVNLGSSGAHIWSSYVGGTKDEGAIGVAMDSVGNSVITGTTLSADWTAGGFDGSYNGLYDAFAAKLDSGGHHIWSTYLGGNDYDWGRAISTDTSDNVFVAGWTCSSGWMFGGFDVSYNGGEYDAFVVKLNASGNRVWSTYLGGGDADYGDAIVADALGNVFVGGNTRSDDWPGSGSVIVGWNDAFVANLDADGNYVWSMLFGGSQVDEVKAIALDGLSAILVAGDTTSPWLSGGFDTSYGGTWDGFVARITVSIPGDANADGVVDDKDASILGTHWQQQSGATWAMGDFNLDGKVNDMDAAILAAHWGEQATEAAEPPATSGGLSDGPVGVALIGPPPARAMPDTRRRLSEPRNAAREAAFARSFDCAESQQHALAVACAFEGVQQPVRRRLIALPDRVVARRVIDLLFSDLAQR